jgi:hypothetical protein
MNIYLPIIIAIALIFKTTLFALNLSIPQNICDGIAPSARSMAMGWAGAGLSNNKEGFYFNSSSLADFNGTLFEISFIPISNTNNLSEAMLKTGLNSVLIVKDSASLSWRNLADYSFSNTGIDKSVISAKAISLSIGKKSPSNYNVGFSLSYIYAQMSHVSYNADYGFQSLISSGNGFTLDISFLYPLAQGFHFGANFKNLVGYLFWSGGYGWQQLPFSYILGLGFEYKSFSLALDWDKRFYRYSDLDGDFIRLGLEQDFYKTISLRSGFISATDFNDNDFKFTYGIAFKIKKSYEISISAENNSLKNNNFYSCIIALSFLGGK